MTTEPAKRRIFAIGDVHGCARELDLLLAKIQPQPEDLVVFLGDYIDRGPDAKTVIDLVIELRRRCEVICLKGNHEDMFLDFLERPASKGAGLFILNGGSATLASYGSGGGSFEIPREHIEFLYTLKLWHETDDYFFVHAGVPEQPLSTIRTEDDAFLLWAREPFLSSEYNWGKLIVHGHTPMPLIEQRPNRINIDTGCVFDGHLTAVELPAMTFHQVHRQAKLEPVRQLTISDDVRIAVRFEGRLPIRAGRFGEMKDEFETLNYNQFGLLMRDPTPGKDPKFNAGDAVEGVIGMAPSASADSPWGSQTQSPTDVSAAESGAASGAPTSEVRDPVQFSGTIVRSETRGTFPVYAIKIDRITDGSDGRKWITRPEPA